MRVEDCCQALLRQILPDIDPHGNGYCLDVGVGTFAFYCELFVKLGFPTIAVEPSPVHHLRRLCNRHSIQLIEACLSDHNGTQTLYMGKFIRFANQNFNSLHAEWFGSSSQTKQVTTLNLPELLRITEVHKMTCLKLDIEGWEPIIIQQLAELPASHLPVVVMFEYGGGGPRHHGRKGWTPFFTKGTLTCLRTLKYCGYGFSIMIDSSHKAQAQFLDLQSHSLETDDLFPSNAMYGNIISFRDCEYPKDDVVRISKPFQGGIANWLVEKLIINKIILHQDY